MGLKWKWLVLLAVVLVLLIPTTAFAAPSEEDRVIFGGSYTLGAGEVLDGDLLVLGGKVEIGTGARVAGNVTIVGGDTRIDGRVDGDVSQVGGKLVLEENSHVYGDVINNGGSVQRLEGAQLDGEIRTGARSIEVGRNRPNKFGSFILDSFWKMFILFSAAALTVVIAALWQPRLSNVSNAITQQPLMAGATGLLIVGVAVPVLVLIMITIIAIPISLAGFVILAAAGAFGWAALSQEIGLRLGKLAKREWTPALAAGIGAILLGMIYIGIGQLPCLGWAMQTILVLIGLGAVTLTRFGSEAYPEKTEE